MSRQGSEFSEEFEWDNGVCQFLSREAEQLGCFLFLTTRYLSGKSNYIEYFMVVTAVAELDKLMETSRDWIWNEEIFFFFFCLKFNDDIISFLLSKRCKNQGRGVKFN